jgi:hypothetical protein
MPCPCSSRNKNLQLDCSFIVYLVKKENAYSMRAIKVKTPGRSVMSNLGKLVTRIGLLSLFSVMPLAAQMDTTLKFTAPFPFYVGNTRMPSGSYIITQPTDSDLGVVFFSSIDRSKHAAIVVIPTQSTEAPKQSKVIFEKYGDNLYFNRVLVDGSVTGVLAEPTKTEKKAEQHASVAEQYSVTVAGQ